MANVKSGVVEITWKSGQPLGSRSPCEIIFEFLRTPETERVDYSKPDKCLPPDIRIRVGDIRECHHVFVQVTLKSGHFGDYADSLQARARVHESVSTAVWRRRQALVVGGAARLGEVCVGAQSLDK